MGEPSCPRGAEPLQISDLAGLLYWEMAVLAYSHSVSFSFFVVFFFNSGETQCHRAFTFTWHVN